MAADSINRDCGWRPAADGRHTAGTLGKCNVVHRPVSPA